MLDHIEDCTISTPSNSSNYFNDKYTATNDESVNGAIKLAEVLVSEFDEASSTYQSVVFRLNRKFDYSVMLNAFERSISKDFEEDTRFCLFFCLVIRYVLNGDHTSTDVMEFYHSHEEEFSERPMHSFLGSLSYRQSSKPQNKKKALKMGYGAATEIAGHSSPNPNVFSNFAGLAVRFAEEYDELWFTIEGVSNNFSDLLSVAEDYIRRALEIAQPIVYIWILARLLYLQGDLEDSESTCRALLNSPRISENKPPVIDEVENFLRRVEQEQIDEKIQEARREYQELQRNLEEIENEFEESIRRYRNQNLQFLGFFAAIIAIIVGSISLINSQASFEAASRLILILIGGVIVSFGSLRLVIVEEISFNDVFRSAPILLAGAALIWLGFNQSIL